jgi:hypothetical protein
MKKLFALLLFLLTACSPASEPAVIVTDVENDVPPTAVPNVESPGAFSPAATVAEAAVIRPEDQVIGAEDPAVAIIEYGDYQ